MKTFVIGDIHGAYKALVQCLERSGFNRFEDRLIVLGDVCDVFPEVRQCFDLLLGFKNCDYIIGNHDLWALDWALSGKTPFEWKSQGGDQTVVSYSNHAMPQNHLDFLNKAHFFLEIQGMLFVHAGFDPRIPVKLQKTDTLSWDRELVLQAYRQTQNSRPVKIGDYEAVFVGHTPTQSFHVDVPLQLGNLWLMDTGAGWGKSLSIMNVGTKEYWQSDLTSSLYETRVRHLE